MKNQVLLLIISKDHRQLLLIKFIKALKWSVINWIKKGWILCKKRGKCCRYYGFTLANIKNCFITDFRCFHRISYQIFHIQLQYLSTHYFMIIFLDTYRMKAVKRTCFNKLLNITFVFHFATGCQFESRAIHIMLLRLL